MPEDAARQTTLIRPLRAFLATYRLQEIQNSSLMPEGEFRRTFRMFASGEDTLQLQYRRQEHDHLIRVLQQMYPGKLDRSTISKKVLDICREWILEDADVQDDEALAKAVSQLVTSIQESISKFRVLIPLDGIEIETSSNLELGLGILVSNSERSELIKSSKRIQDELGEHEIYEVFEQAPSYFECQIIAQQKRAISTGPELANQALDVLRLFIGSHYFHRFRAGSIRAEIGLAGTLDTRKDQSLLLLSPDKPADDQVAGASFGAEHLESHSLTDEIITEIENHGLHDLNSLLAGDFTGPQADLPRRISRAVKWFAKAVTANTLADAFLLYAISIEALLSQDRTPQRSYAEWIAALVTRDADVRIYPIGGHMSKALGKELSTADSLSHRYLAIRSRCLELFGLRNRIAHGAVLDEEIEPVMLLDLETITRNSILAFLDGGWGNIGQFRQWFSKSVTTKFDPQ